MDELDDLYQEVILDHYKKPRNFGILDAPDRHAEGNNPLCGDRLFLTVKMKGDTIEDLRFKGAGCAISTAARPNFVCAHHSHRADAEAAPVDSTGGCSCRLRTSGRIFVSRSLGVSAPICL